MKLGKIYYILKIGRLVDRVGRISKGVLKNESSFEAISCPKKGVMNGEGINGFGGMSGNKE